MRQWALSLAKQMQDKVEYYQGFSICVADVTSVHTGVLLMDLAEGILRQTKVDMVVMTRKSGDDGHFYLACAGKLKDQAKIALQQLQAQGLSLKGGGKPAAVQGRLAADDMMQTESHIKQMLDAWASA